MAFGLSAVIRLRDEFTSNMRKARESTEKFNKSMEKVRSAGESMNDAGRKMTKSITLPIVGFAALSVKAASDFESAFAGVNSCPLY